MESGFQKLGLWICRCLVYFLTYLALWCGKSCKVLRLLIEIDRFMDEDKVSKTVTYDVLYIIRKYQHLVIKLISSRRNNP
jgi:hypothetical protein